MEVRMPANFLCWEPLCRRKQSELITRESPPFFCVHFRSAVGLRQSTDLRDGIQGSPQYARRVAPSYSQGSKSEGCLRLGSTQLSSRSGSSPTAPGPQHI